MTSMNADLARARDLLQHAKRIAVLTGAGISAESGIPTFRGAGGLWKQFQVEDLATPQAFQRNPQLWHEGGGTLPSSPARSAR